MAPDRPTGRGTLEIVFKYTPYDELKRLGLNAGTEASMRKAYPKLTGMLVVEDASAAREVAQAFVGTLDVTANRE